MNVRIEDSVKRGVNRLVRSRLDEVFRRKLSSHFIDECHVHFHKNSFYGLTKYRADIL